MDSRKVRGVYSEQFRKEAVAMVVELGHSRTKVVADLGISVSALGRC